MEGYVAQEQPCGRFIPDIAVYANAKAEHPTCILEVVGTSEPSGGKLQHFASVGVPVFRVDAGMNPQATMFDPLLVTPLVCAPCGKDVRSFVSQIDEFWLSATDPFIGIKFFPSGAQEYLYGERDREASWTYGEPEIRGFCKMDVLWPSAPMVNPVGKPRTLRRDQFIALLMWMKARILTSMCLRDPDSSTGWVRMSRLDETGMKHIEDLRHMVLYPIS